MSTNTLFKELDGPELTWVGDGAWIARDRALSDADPGKVIAYLEHKQHRVYVLWVRDRRETESYDTLRDALDSVAAVCATPERRGEAPR